MQFEITEAIITVQVPNTDDYEIYSFCNFLCEQETENKWENASEIRTYKEEDGKPHHYIKWGEIEEEIKEKITYVFMRETGAFIHELNQEDSHE